MKKIEDKIFKLGLRALDELLLHRNASKETKISLEDASALSNFIVHVGPHGIITLNEEEIKEFYRVWVENQ